MSREIVIWQNTLLTGIVTAKIIGDSDSSKSRVNQ